MKKIIILTLIVMAILFLNLFGMSGEEILRKVDANVDFDSATYTGTMEIYVKNRKPRIKKMKAYSIGESKAYTEFINKEDVGIRYLKVEKNLWVYDDSEENTFLIAGSRLKEGMMGSDVSYEDALESDSIYKKYDIKLIGEETVDGVDCYVVDLNAKVKKVSYHKRKMWVDKERFVQMKEEKYSKSGKLLKTTKTLKVEKIGDRYYPTKVEFEDKLKRGSKTVFIMSDMSFDKKLDEKYFTRRYLER